MVIALVEDHHFVLLGAAAGLAAGALGESLYQHIELTALILLVLLGGDFRLEGDELIQSANLLLFGNIVGQMF